MNGFPPTGNYGGLSRLRLCLGALSSERPRMAKLAFWEVVSIRIKGKESPISLVKIDI